MTKKIKKTVTTLSIVFLNVLISFAGTTQQWKEIMVDVKANGMVFMAEVVWGALLYLNRKLALKTIVVQVTCMRCYDYQTVNIYSQVQLLGEYLCQISP